MPPAITCLRHAIGRHSGYRGLRLVLAFALLCMSWPQLELHTHAHGDQAHTHAIGHDAHDPQGPDDPDAPGVMHVHDTATAACALPCPQPPMATAPVSVLNAALASCSPVLAAQSPPHRPPIV
jgi:hypothetical protein